MHSMTGFGRGSTATDHWQATVEASSVNRKQTEVVVQLPREVAELETPVRKAVLSAISRGRVQVNIRLDRPQSAAAPVSVNEPLAIALDATLVKLGTALGRPLEPSASDFLRLPGVIAVGSEAMEPDQVWQALEPALSEALSQLVAMRRREGNDLKQDFVTRLAALRAYAETIHTMAPARLPRQREQLLKRLIDVGLEFDLRDERVLRELALFADRCDISEELTRLAAHFARFDEYLDGDEPAGRALDFLCQEISREFNTIGSKANDSAIAHAVVEAKTELEKIREQIQNIE